ncbi:MAG: hypothetical protein ACOVQN_04425 [Exiguobacterium sp.]
MEDVKYIPVGTRFVSFHDADYPLFWQLWVQFPDTMLCCEVDGTPFTDLFAPLNDFVSTYFVKCEWTPEYEYLRSELEACQYKHLLANIEMDIQKARDKLDQHLARKEHYTQLLQKVHKQ